ncbi:MULTISPECIES: DUF928 domain-containing protein [unclassified Nostoc]|uniref:DUF928 domain-containing protein n=1 Tax=unclassified Nostoc TaxID=2593658 RepID=UPI002AD2574E|nr:DUF928 domain-containing protein [Nostoc sp. DedQUE03]MDZ7975739.1 DUF928 domain-containing protein [Nostoc sp. DedQUE03]MDZ8048442.1 DUF928 domain-containing protein [Nostoc sp. DedQUE02]
MIKKFVVQPIQRACVIPLILISLMSYSPSVQAQQTNSIPNIVKNSSFQSSQQPKLPRNGAPTGRRRAGAGRSPECPSSLTRLTALAPGDGGESVLASTVAENPTFWFYVPQLPQTIRSGEFVLQVLDGKDVQNVYRTPLTLSGKAGIVSITLPAQPQYFLKIDKKYHWYFHIYCGDVEKTSDNFYVDGFVQRQVLTEALDSQLKLAKPKEYIVYSANNIWYDALTNLGQQRRTNPQNATLNQDWVDLLNAVGLQDIAKEPIVQDYNLEK